MPPSFPTAQERLCYAQQLMLMQESRVCAARIAPAHLRQPEELWRASV